MCLRTLLLLGMVNLFGLDLDDSTSTANHFKWVLALDLDRTVRLWSTMAHLSAWTVQVGESGGHFRRDARIHLLLLLLRHLVQL